MISEKFNLFKLPVQVLRLSHSLVTVYERNVWITTYRGRLDIRVIWLKQQLDNQPTNQQQYLMHSTVPEAS